ncbi:MAG: phosphate/phosphite/phosphonate ABC transporter substrate-binding protein [Deltaproteobacteria bacterium]|nr:phosphate/phosphite/phosphonate ABC transporter substrate-binding protein [Deltaproteobacteria bacterium]
MKGFRLVFRASTIVCIALLAAAVSRAEDKTPLKIGGRSTSAGPKAMVEKYQPLMDYLSVKIGRPVEFHPSTSYPEVLGKLASGEIQAAILGSAGGARAVRDLGATPVARPEKGGVSGYRGCLIVRKDSGLKRIEDLKGKHFDYVEKGTSAGHLFPRALLVSKKLAPDSFFGTVSYSGKHDIAVMKVMNGGADGASVKDQDLEKLSRSDPQVRERIVVLQKSGLYPDGTLLFRKGAAAATVKSVESALLGLGADPGGKAALSALGADRYIATGKKDFAELIRAMTLLKE